LLSIDKRITGHHFGSRLRRLILLSNWDDHYDERGQDDVTFDARLSALASEAVSNVDALQSLISDLVSGDNNAVYPFGYHLCKADEAGRLLPLIVDAYRRLPSASHSALLLGGYLRSVSKRNPLEWETLVGTIIKDPAFAQIAGPLLQCCGFTDGVVERLIAEVDAGRIGRKSLRSLTGAPFELRRLNPNTIESLIDRLLVGGDVSYAREVAHFAYCHEGNIKQLPRQLTQRLLTYLDENTQGRRESGYVWSVLAQQFATQYPDERLQLFEAIIDAVCAGKGSFDYHDHAYVVVQQFVESDPRRCWAVIAKRLEGAKSEKWHLLMWLEPPPAIGSENPAGPLALFPSELVLEWVDQDPTERAPIIARCAPKSLGLDDFASLPCELLKRYGDIEEVRHSLLRNFYSTGWAGSESAHFRKQRDVARRWLQAETSFRVRNWIEEYIRSLNASIDRATIEEERDRDD
jgi:hypothetical protein